MSKKCKRLDYARKMPPLRHSVPGKGFDWKDSEVMRWLSTEPHIADYFFHLVYSSGAIVYDPELQVWKGADA